MNLHKIMTVVYFRDILTNAVENTTEIHKEESIRWINKKQYYKEAMQEV
jgi:hypothetical protein